MRTICSIREDLFVADLFISGMNGALACRKHYPKCKNPNQQAYKILQRPQVKAAIEAKKAELAVKLDIKESELLAELRSMSIPDANCLDSRGRKVSQTTQLAAIKEARELKGYGKQPIDVTLFAGYKPLSAEERVRAQGIMSQLEGANNAIQRQDKAEESEQSS